MVVDVRKDLNRNERTERNERIQHNATDLNASNGTQATQRVVTNRRPPSVPRKCVCFRRHIPGSGPKKTGFGLKLVVFGEKRPFCLKERTFLKRFPRKLATRK